MVKINCPNCNQEYEVDESMVGQKVQCGVCDVHFSVQLEDSRPDSHTGNQGMANDKSNDKMDAVNNSNAPATCPHCGNENAPGTTFCIFCGKAIDSPRKCPACDTTLLAKARFCPKCGREVGLNSDSNSSSTPQQMPAVVSKLLSFGTRIKGAIYQSVMEKKDDNTYSFSPKKMFTSPTTGFAATFLLLAAIFLIIFLIVFGLKGQRGIEAKYRLGLRYYKGEDVKQDFTKAAMCFYEAAEKGHAEAQNALGECYYGGEGVEKSNVEAAKWFRKAAEQGLPKAQTYLGQCYYDGDGIKEDKEEAVKWFRKAAEHGYAEAQASLAGCYIEGSGVQKNAELAAKWLRKAAEQGHAKAQVSLGLLYTMGEGVKQDYTEAAKWYRKAAEQGCAEAQFAMGACYSRGQGVKMDIAEGIKWYRLAADQGYKPARDQLDELSKIRDSLSELSNSIKELQKAASSYSQTGQSNGGYPVVCTRCGGKGVVPGLLGVGYDRCPDCNGTGYEGDYERALRRNPYK